MKLPTQFSIPTLVLLGCALTSCLFNPHEREEFRDFYFQSISLQENLVYYHFNESSYTGTVGDIRDSAPNNRNSNSLNSPTKSQGIFGDGLYCDGTNGVDITPSIFDDAFNERTISIWFRAERVDGIRYIYEEGGGTNGINIYIENGLLYGGTYKHNGVDFSNFPSLSVVANLWYHVAITYDDVDGFNFYVNGAKIAGPLPTGFAFPSHSNDNGLCFQNDDSFRHTGSDTQPTGQYNYFRGVVDELAVWNRLLTDQELSLLYLRQGRLD